MKIKIALVSFGIAVLWLSYQNANITWAGTSRTGSQQTDVGCPAEVDDPFDFEENENRIQPSVSGNLDNSAAQRFVPVVAGPIIDYNTGEVLASPLNRVHVTEAASGRGYARLFAKGINGDVLLKIFYPDDLIPPEAIQFKVRAAIRYVLYDPKSLNSLNQAYVSFSIFKGSQEIYTEALFPGDCPITTHYSNEYYPIGQEPVVAVCPYYNIRDITIPQSVDDNDIQGRLSFQWRLKTGQGFYTNFGDASPCRSHGGSEGCVDEFVPGAWISIDEVNFIGREGAAGDISSIVTPHVHIVVGRRYDPDSYKFLAGGQELYDRDAQIESENMFRRTARTLKRDICCQAGVACKIHYFATGKEFANLVNSLKGQGPNLLIYIGHSGIGTPGTVSVPTLTIGEGIGARSFNLDFVSETRGGLYLMPEQGFYHVQKPANAGPGAATMNDIQIGALQDMKIIFAGCNSAVRGPFDEPSLLEVFNNSGTALVYGTLDGSDFFDDEGKRYTRGYFNEEGPVYLLPSSAQVTEKAPGGKTRSRTLKWRAIMSFFVDAIRSMGPWDATQSYERGQREVRPRR